MVLVCVKFVEQLFTCSSTFLNCPTIGTLSHNTYNKVLKEISILWRSITRHDQDSNCGTSSLYNGSCGSCFSFLVVVLVVVVVLVSCIHIW